MGCAAYVPEHMGCAVAHPIFELRIQDAMDQASDRGSKRYNHPRCCSRCAAHGAGRMGCIRLRGATYTWVAQPILGLRRSLFRDGKPCALLVFFTSGSCQRLPAILGKKKSSNHGWLSFLGTKLAPAFLLPTYSDFSI